MIYYITKLNITEVRNTTWETIPQWIFIQRDHHYNDNNKRKKWKNK